jgi:hypothetical protein
VNKLKKIVLVLLLTGVLMVGLYHTEAFAAPVLLNPGDSLAAVASSMPSATFVTSIDRDYYGINDSIELMGTLHQEVWKENDTGYLIFVYKVNHGIGSDDPLGRITTTNYAGYKTWLAYDLNSVAPAGFTRSAGSGSTIGFVFPGATGLPQGDNSSIMWIKTDAFNYKSGGTNMIDGATASVQTYAPAPGTPEPASAMLLGMGLIGFAGRLIRRKFMA